MKKFLFVLVVMGLVFSSGPVWAKDGFYIGGDLGIAVAPGMDMSATDNDYGTRCDKHANPSEFQTDANLGGLPPSSTPGNVPKASDCDKRPPDTQWFHNFDGGTGILAGVALGYRLGSFRVEGEYLYRGTTYDSTDPNTTVTDEETTKKFREELDVIEGAVDDVLSHNFFANLYYDHQLDSKFTPYVGFGVGFAQVSLDYFGRFKRRRDPSEIKTFDERVGGHDAETARTLNKEIAGTTTIGRAKFSDTLFGYQVVAGVDYQVSEPVTIGLKFRWADFGEFKGGEEWDQLRSHESANMRPEDPVRYRVMTDDIQFWGVSLNMKYQF